MTNSLDLRDSPSAFTLYEPENKSVSDPEIEESESNPDDFPDSSLKA